MNFTSAVVVFVFYRDQLFLLVYFHFSLSFYFLFFFSSPRNAFISFLCQLILNDYVGFMSHFNRLCFPFRYNIDYIYFRCRTRWQSIKFTLASLLFFQSNWTKYFVFFLTYTHIKTRNGLWLFDQTPKVNQIASFCPKFALFSCPNLFPFLTLASLFVRLFGLNLLGFFFNLDSNLFLFGIHNPDVNS